MFPVLMSEWQQSLRLKPEREKHCVTSVEKLVQGICNHLVVWELLVIPVRKATEAQYKHNICLSFNFSTRLH